jgi:hypothetical protein
MPLDVERFLTVAGFCILVYLSFFSNPLFVPLWQKGDCGGAFHPPLAKHPALTGYFVKHSEGQPPPSHPTGALRGVASLGLQRPFD